MWPKTGLRHLTLEGLGPLFRKSTNATNLNLNINPNTVTHICTVDFRNSGPVPTGVHVTAE